VRDSEVVNISNDVTARDQFWLQEVKNLQTSYKSIIYKYPDADHVLQQVYKVLGDIMSLADYTLSVGESEM
jgi:hypothetical protein